MKPCKREPFLIDIVDKFIEFDDAAVTDAKEFAGLKVRKGKPAAPSTSTAAPKGAAARPANGAKKGHKRPKRRDK